MRNGRSVLIKHSVMRNALVGAFASINFLSQPFRNCKESYSLESLSTVIASRVGR